FAITDAKGRRAKLNDFIVELLAEDYPPVTHVLFRHKSHAREVLPWDAVVSIDHSTRQIKVRDVEASEIASEEWLKRKVLLRDIDDSQILDLQHHRATRANGLLLREENGRLLLSAVDSSVSALFRHVTGGRFSFVPQKKVLDWTAVEFLRGDPQGVKSGLPYRHRISRLPAGEIARLTAQLPYMHAAELVTLL